MIVKTRGLEKRYGGNPALADVQEVCDTVGIPREGRLLVQGALHDLLVGRAVPAYLVRLRPPAGRVAAALRAKDTAVLLTPAAESYASCPRPRRAGTPASESW
ncbi:hypothetical protein AB0K18_35645 [Nonomuraea sp. NPDC049421]|uniref:hypothetical protein n=1 Tax=Nonomuraea sp. NPDC049421 TaxID=3155275 RepID=UPI003441B3C6